MNITTSVSEILRNHVTLEVESIDRMYLNVYVPQLQRELGVVSFIKYHLGQPVPSTVVVAKRSKGFVEAVKRFAREQRLPIVPFKKGERKEDVARKYLSGFEAEEGVLFIGRAQEKTPVFRTEKRHRPDTGESYPWIVRSTAR